MWRRESVGLEFSKTVRNITMIRVSFLTGKSQRRKTGPRATIFGLPCLRNNRKVDTLATRCCYNGGVRLVAMHGTEC